jgi:dTDP-glucose pyrophosphorylase
MQVVILAAGRSSRFYPYNYFPHKSLIKILGKLIIVHTIESIKKSGIKDIILIVSKDSEIKKILGNGKNLQLIYFCI